MATSNIDDNTFRGMFADYAKRGNWTSLLKENIRTVIALFLIIAIIVVWLVFRPSPSEEGKVATPAASAPKSVGPAKVPTASDPFPNAAFKPEQPKEKTAEAVPQQEPPQAAASQPAKPEEKKEEVKPPAKEVKPAPPAPRTPRTAVAESKQPSPAHKAAMGNNAGFVKAASAGPVYYASRDQCEAAWHAGRAVEYHPTAKSKSYGPARVEGLTLRGGEGPACAYMETAIGDRWVFFSQGKGLYTDGATVKFLAECQNTIHRIVFLKKEESVAALPPAVQETVVSTTVIEEKKILKVVPYCELPDGTQVKATIVNNDAVCPDLKFRAPVAVDQPIRIQPRQSPPVYTPPIAAPQAPVPCTNCTPQAHVPGQEPAPHGVCGIRAVGSNRQTVGLVQIDTFQGKVRIARVAQWGGRPTHRPVLTDLPTSPRRNCDDDQAQVERHWAHVIKMLELPLDCVPGRGRP